MAEPYPDQDQPERRDAAQQGPVQRQRRPERRRQRDRVRSEDLHRPPLPRPSTLAHPVIAGYDGSSSARNALAYAAGMARRLGRPLLVVYVTSPGVYCEPLTGQVVGLPRDSDALEQAAHRAGPGHRPKRTRSARADAAREPGTGTGRDGVRIQRRCPGDRRAQALLAPRRRLGSRLARPPRELPGHRRALTGVTTVM